MLTEAGRVLRRIVAPLVAVTLVTLGLGLLVRGGATWPLRHEDTVVRALSHHRTATWDDVTSAVTVLGSLPVITAVTVVAVAALLLTRARRSAAFLAGAVGAQALVWLVVRTVVDRGRPDTSALDAAGAGDGFPSGHTACALALYGGVAVLLAAGLRRRNPRAARWTLPLVWTVGLAMPAMIGFSRLYRGAQHPSDVVVSLLVGTAVLVILAQALLSPRAVWGRPRRLPAPPGSRQPQAAVIVNPIKLDAVDDRVRILRTLREAGWAPPMWLETTVVDPGAGVARRAVEAGVDLVVVCGGDGTVRECADVLSGTGIPLAVLPAGTGNLLARNLGLPIDLADAIHVAVHGQDRRIDLGAVEADLPQSQENSTSGSASGASNTTGIASAAAESAPGRRRPVDTGPADPDSRESTGSRESAGFTGSSPGERGAAASETPRSAPPPEDGIVTGAPCTPRQVPDRLDRAPRERCFTAMAGIGLDAAMVADAPDALKKKVGWPAYAVSGARHLRDARMRVTLRIDDGAPVKRRARMVLVGNVGSLQGGMQLLPGAEPDDGRLDVVVFAPYGLTGWAHAAVRVVGRRRSERPVVPPRQRRWRPVEHFSARTVLVETDRPEPRELDGDPIGAGTRLAVRVRPGALLVRVPRGSTRWVPPSRAGHDTAPLGSGGPNGSDVGVDVAGLGEPASAGDALPG